LTHLQQKKWPLNQVDEEVKAKEAGFRNFTSFAFICYYDKKLSLKRSGEIINISTTKMRTSLLKRGFPPRAKGTLPGIAPKKKRRVDVEARVREHTPFVFPWCALYIYYEKYFLTSHEISDLLHISQPLICKLLRKYKIKVRKQGVKKIGRKI